MWICIIQRPTWFLAKNMKRNYICFGQITPTLSQSQIPCPKKTTFHPPIEILNSSIKFPWFKCPHPTAGRNLQLLHPGLEEDFGGHGIAMLHHGFPIRAVPDIHLHRAAARAEDLHVAEDAGAAAQLIACHGMKPEKKADVMVMKSGVGNCPIKWEYWTSPQKVAIKKTIYLMVGNPQKSPISMGH